MEKKITTAIAISLLVLAIGLFFGFVSNSYAVSNHHEQASDTKKNVQKYQAMAHTNNVLRYSEILLNRSTVAHNLKFSGNDKDRARYSKAMGIYQQAARLIRAATLIKL
jgi:hypothetical protein